MNCRGILEFLERSDGPGSEGEGPFLREQVAAAALMVECAAVDTDFAEDEREAIRNAVRECFRLDDETSEALLELAEQHAESAWHDFRFLDAVRRGFDREERRAILSTLWDVANADGLVHPFEQHLIERIAQQLEIPEPQVEDARKASEARLRA